MPCQDAQLVLVEAGQRGNVRFITDPDLEHRAERHAVVAFYRKPLSGHFAEHPKDIEHGLVDAIARERPKSCEIRLVLELERPRQRAFEVYAMLLSELMAAGETRG